MSDQTMSLDELEKALQEDSNTQVSITPHGKIERLAGPSVTVERIEQVIAGEYYLSGNYAVPLTGALPLDHCKELGLITICILILKNGFKVIGDSVPVSAENFNQQKGREIARQKAVQQIWALEGYLLKQGLWQAACNERAQVSFDPIGDGPAGMIG